MSKSRASTPPSPARTEAAAAWIIRSNDGPLAAADRAGLDAWKAKSPHNAAAFSHAEAVWTLFDDPHGDPALDALRTEAYAHGRHSPHAKN